MIKSNSKGLKKLQKGLKTVVNALEKVVGQTQSQEGKIEQLQNDVLTLKQDLLAAMKEIVKLQNLKNQMLDLDYKLSTTNSHVKSLDYMAQSENQLQDYMYEESLKDATDFKMTKDELSQGIEKYKNKKASFSLRY